MRPILLFFLAAMLQSCMFTESVCKKQGATPLAGFSGTYATYMAGGPRQLHRLNWNGNDYDYQTDDETSKTKKIQICKVGDRNYFEFEDTDEHGEKTFFVFHIEPEQQENDHELIGRSAGDLAYFKIHRQAFETQKLIDHNVSFEEVDDGINREGITAEHELYNTNILADNSHLTATESVSLWGPKLMFYGALIKVDPSSVEFP